MSLPTFVALHFIAPERFIVEAKTLSPSFLSTGRLSPVREDSSTAPSPESTTPSEGTDEPGLKTKISPTFSSPMVIVFSSPSLMTKASFGFMAKRDFRASVVLPLLLASNIFPRVIRVKIVPADSKYRAWREWWAAILSICVINRIS